MPDLRTEDANVSNVWNTWIKDMVSNYNIDGFRMDSTYEVNQASLRPLQDAGM
jgi:alpha-amylase